MKFSIVIPTKNRAQKIKNKLDRLSELDFPKENFEVIVIDNDSSDQTSQILSKYPKKDLNLTSLYEKNAGPSAARNLGIKFAKHNYIIFTDDDVLVTKDFLKLYELAWKEHPTASVIGGPVIAKAKKGLTDKQQKMITRHAWVFGDLFLGDEEKEIKQGEILFSANMSVKRQSKKDLSVFFDENFGKVVNTTYRIGAEDLELCNRFLLSKKEIWYIPDLKVVNSIENDRFSDRYIASRYFFSGLEVFLVDEKLKKLFGKKYTTYGEYFMECLFGSWKGIFLTIKWYGRSKYEILMLFSYFLHQRYLRVRPNFSTQNTSW